MGYVSYYSGSGTVSALATYVANAPTMSTSSSGTSNFALLLNTGSLSSCTGFMQAGVLGVIANDQYWPGYMDGVSGCGGTFYSNPNFPPGHELSFYMDIYNTSTSYFQVVDVNTNSIWTKLDKNVGTWTQNSFQTMSESSSSLTTIGDTNYENAEFFVNCPRPCNGYYVGGAGTTTPAAYGGVCSQSSYALGSWSNTIYGYNEPGFTIEGFCAVSMAGEGVLRAGDSHNWVTNPSGIVGAPDGSLNTLAAGNSGDGAWVIGDLGQSHSPASSYTFRLYVNTYTGYSSFVFAYYSKDNVTWSLIGDYQVTNTSPSWISIGTFSFQARYIRVLAQYYNGYSSKIAIDSEAITW